MTTNESNYSKSQLARILSALEFRTCKPNSKEAALAAIEHRAAKIGLTTNDVFAYAPGLLDGRLSEDAFRDALADEMPRPPEVDTEATTDEPVEAEDEIIIPTQSTAKQDLLAAAKRAAEVLAEHEIEPDAQAMLNTVIGVADQTSRRHRVVAERRGQTKQEAMIEMLKRDEGATIAQMAEAMGWQAHTVRGAMAGALKKKLGLNVTSSGKVDGRGRVYHIE